MLIVPSLCSSCIVKRVTCEEQNKSCPISQESTCRRTHTYTHANSHTDQHTNTRTQTIHSQHGQRWWQCFTPTAYRLKGMERRVSLHGRDLSWSNLTYSIVALFHPEKLLDTLRCSYYPIDTSTHWPKLTRKSHARKGCKVMMWFVERDVRAASGSRRQQAVGGVLIPDVFPPLIRSRQFSTFFTCKSDLLCHFSREINKRGCVLLEIRQTEPK